MILRGVSQLVCFEAIRNRSRPIAVLVGAGCSASANVPLASGFVKTIKQRYQQRLKEVTTEEYSEVTSHLTEDEWLNLFWDDIAKARVNLAHICLAELVKHGIIDRVLTTNFDGLIVRACSLVNAPIGVCDCVSMPSVERVFEEQRPAVYHLHGQAGGMGMWNSGIELAKRASWVRDVVRRTIDRRILLVAGYSGACDGVLDFLRDEAQILRNPVFWVPWPDATLVSGDLEKTVKADMHLYIIEACKSDNFFFDLLLALGLSLPAFLRDEKQFAMGVQCAVGVPDDFANWLAQGKSAPPETAAPDLSRPVGKPWTEGK